MVKKKNGEKAHTSVAMQILLALYSVEEAWRRRVRVTIKLRALN